MWSTSFWFLEELWGSPRKSLLSNKHVIIWNRSWRVERPLTPRLTHALLTSTYLRLRDCRVDLLRAGFCGASTFGSIFVLLPDTKSKELNQSKNKWRANSLPRSVSSTVADGREPSRGAELKEAFQDAIIRSKSLFEKRFLTTGGQVKVLMLFSNTWQQVYVATLAF